MLTEQRLFIVGGRATVFCASRLNIMQTSVRTSFTRFFRGKTLVTQTLVSKEAHYRQISSRTIQGVRGKNVNYEWANILSFRQSLGKRFFTTDQLQGPQRTNLEDGAQILSAELLLERENLMVKMISEGHSHPVSNTERDVENQEFPFVWLRDNCQCTKCFHSEAFSRMLQMLDFDVDCRPTSLVVSEDKGSITLVWQDGHESTFKADWLNERAFTPRARALRLINYRGNRVLWDARDFYRINEAAMGSDTSWRFSYTDIISKDSSLLAWLEYLETWGIAMVVGAEPINGQLQKLVDRVAFVRRTHYGELFSVRAKDEPSNVAYTSEKLQLHTDLPYYEYKPGVNMLQCLVQWKGSGGENHLVDSFAVAELMRQEYPNEYSILSTTLVDWADIGQEPEGVEEDLGTTDGKRERRAFHSIYRAPVICEDREGYIVRVNVSQPQRDSHFCVKLSQVSAWYAAFNVFAHLLHNPHFCVTYKLNPGEILAFDNLRTCHGRGAYGTSTVVTETLERHVKGAYMDWDEVRSRIRTLRKSVRLEEESKVS